LLNEGNPLKNISRPAVEPGRQKEKNSLMEKQSDLKGFLEGDRTRVRKPGKLSFYH